MENNENNLNGKMEDTQPEKIQYKHDPKESTAMINRGFAMTFLTIKSILFDKKTLAVGIILLILLAIPVMWLRNPPTDKEDASLEMFLIILIFIYLQFIVLYVCFLFGSALITSEIDDRTMTYLISRPISKFEIIVYKYIGYVISIFILFAIPVIFNYLILAPHEGAGEISENWKILAYSLGGIFIGVIAWGALFLFLATVFKNPIMPGFLYCIFWESIIANLPSNISKTTITYQIRTFIFNGLKETSKFLSEDGDLPQHGSYSPGSAFFSAIVISVFFIFFAWFMIRNKDFN